MQLKNEKHKEKVVVIVSGGMDSITLLHDIKNKNFDVHALTFDYGQKHIKEINYAKENCKKLAVTHKIINLNILNNIAPSSLTRKNIIVPEGHYAEDVMKQTVVPNRNMVLLSLATSYAISIKATKIFYGAHAGDHTIYPDCRPDFVTAMQKSISLCDWHTVDLHAPYLFLDKSDIVKIGLKLNVDFAKTWTCYKGKDKACGKCGSCVERLEAFNKAGIKDPLEYEQ